MEFDRWSPLIDQPGQDRKWPRPVWEFSVLNPALSALLMHHLERLRRRWFPSSRYRHDANSIDK